MLGWAAVRKGGFQACCGRSAVTLLTSVHWPEQKRGLIEGPLRNWAVTINPFIVLQKYDTVRIHASQFVYPTVCTFKSTNMYFSLYIYRF